MKPVEKIDGFLHFMCGFLAALDLSAVRLYGDDWSTTPSASNCGSPSPLHSAQNKTIIYKKILHFPIAIWYNKSEF